MRITRFIYKIHKIYKISAQSKLRKMQVIHKAITFFNIKIDVYEGDRWPAIIIKITRFLPKGTENA